MRISDWSSDVCSSDLLKGKFRLRLFPKITITVLPPRHFDIPDEARGRRRRQLAGDKLYEVMSDMMFRIHHQDPRTLFQALLESSAIHGAGTAAVEDIRSEEHTSELQSLMRISYAVFCLKKKTNLNIPTH